MSVNLSPEILDSLRTLGDAHDVIRQEIDRAKKAGLDMTELEAQYTQLEAIRKGLISVYGVPKTRRAVG
jgi:hypothetical protein